MTARPNNGRFRANHSIAGAIATGIALVAFAFIGLLIVGAFA